MLARTSTSVPRTTSHRSHPHTLPPSQSHPGRGHHPQPCQALRIGSQGRQGHCGHHHAALPIPALPGEHVSTHTHTHTPSHTHIFAQPSPSHIDIVGAKCEGGDEGDRTGMITVIVMAASAPCPSLCVQAVHVGNKPTRGHPEYALDQAPQPWIDQYRHVCTRLRFSVSSPQPIGPSTPFLSYPPRLNRTTRTDSVISTLFACIEQSFATISTKLVVAFPAPFHLSTAMTSPLVLALVGWRMSSDATLARW